MERAHDVATLARTIGMIDYRIIIPPDCYFVLHNSHCTDGEWPPRAVFEWEIKDGPFEGPCKVTFYCTDRTLWGRRPSVRYSREKQEWEWFARDV